MSNSKKPVVAPAKAASPAPVLAKPIAPVAAEVSKPAAVAAPPVAPKAAEPVVAQPLVTPAPKAVEAPKPVVAAKPAPVAVKPVVAPAAKAVEAPKPAVAAKPAPVAVKPVVVPAPKAVEAPKPVVAAKPAPVAAKPVVAPAAKPVEAPKAVAAPKIAPKSTVKPMSSLPVIDVLKPVAAMQENVRANTEKALTEFRGRYAEVKGLAETATVRLEDSMKAAQSGSREIGFALFEIVKAQTHANLDHAKTLAGAKSLPELVQVQQAFVLSQFQSVQSRAQDVATLAGKVASNVTTPLRASFEQMLRR
jgi:hypothetical protein